VLTLIGATTPVVASYFTFALVGRSDEGYGMARSRPNSYQR